MFQALKRDKGFYRYLAALTGPIALQNLITFSLGLIDTFMVSKLGNNEMAAVTAANVPVFLLISIVFGVQSGVGILISQYWGKKDLTNISRAIGVAAGLGVALALIVALVLFLWRSRSWIFSATSTTCPCWARRICGSSAFPMCSICSRPSMSAPSAAWRTPASA